MVSLKNLFRFDFWFVGVQAMWFRLPAEGEPL